MLCFHIPPQSGPGVSQAIRCMCISRTLVRVRGGKDLPWSAQGSDIGPLEGVVLVFLHNCYIVFSKFMQFFK